jgi:hypothetical protein
MPSEVAGNQLEKAMKDAGYEVLGVIAVKQHPQEPGGAIPIDVTFIVSEEKQDMMLLPNFPIQIGAAVCQVAEWLKAKTLEAAACATKQ